MERPLADAATSHLWRTLFALVVELSLRSGLVTEDDLAPAGPVPPHPEAEGDVHEQGEGSAKENDPILEFAPEPDAETEPRVSQDVQPATDVPTSTTCRPCCGDFQYPSVFYSGTVSCPNGRQPSGCCTYARHLPSRI